MASQARSQRERLVLQRERDRIVALKSSLLVPESGANGKVDAIADLSSPTQHPADLGTETFERAKDLSILASLDTQLADLGRAMDRLERGLYGVCEACGKPIGEARLEAMPATRFCLRDQAAAERRLSA